MALLVRLLMVLFPAAAVADVGDFVGSAHCVQCHATEAQAWQGSHHDLAMAEPGEHTVLGDFEDASVEAHGVTSHFYRRDGGYFVRTDGPDGELREYRVRYTFGWYPLQQYLVEFPNGRLQALGLAWDSRPAEEGGQHWFHLYPGEAMSHRHPLHWAGREQNWNYQCAECHSTDLRKNYDAASDGYRTAYAEIDVACEACHGPGSRHLAWAERSAPDQARDPTRGLAVSLGGDAATWQVDEASGRPYRSQARTDHTEIETCARCHSRRGRIWDEYRHGEPLAQTHRLALLEDGLYFPDGQIRDEVFVYGSFVQSRMHQAGVTCSDCHDAHSLRLRHEGNALCTSCHLQDRYDGPQHHHHPGGSPGAACTACHMPERVYMVNDWRADHSFRVPRPDLSVKLGTPNACNGCHADQASQWAADAVAAWYPQSAHRGPHFGEALHAATSGAADAADRLLAVAGDARQPAIARATAVDRLRQRPSSDHLLTVRRLLGDSDPLVRSASVRFLEVADVRTQVDLAWPLLDDPVRLVRLEAARVLAPLLQQRLPEKLRQVLTAAVEEYAASLAVTAERPESQLSLGLLAVAVGDPARSEQAYRNALRLDTAFVPAYVNLADLYRELGRDEDGEALLRAGMEAAPADATLPHALGLLLVRGQRLQEALPMLAQAAELAPGQPRYAFVYALALEGAGEKEKALVVLQAAGERHPGDGGIRDALERLGSQ
jgi:tetratricopeptide (TPR) repeat protein